MPQESWNNLVHQQQKGHKRKEWECVFVCVCVRGWREEVCLACRPTTMQLPPNLSSCDGSIVLSAWAACTDGGWGFLNLFTPHQHTHTHTRAHTHTHTHTHMHMHMLPGNAGVTPTSVIDCQTGSLRSQQKHDSDTASENHAVRGSQVLYVWAL